MVSQSNMKANKQAFPEDIRGDLRYNFWLNHHEEFNNSLASFFAKELREKKESVVFNTWYVRVKEMADGDHKVKSLTTSQGCTVNRLLRKSWDGTPLSSAEFNQIWGTIAGKDEFIAEVEKLRLFFESKQCSEPLLSVPVIIFFIKVWMLSIFHTKGIASDEGVTLEPWGQFSFHKVDQYGPLVWTPSEQFIHF